MSSDISTKTQECGVSISKRPYSRVYLGVKLRFIVTGLIVLLLPTVTAPSYAKDSAPMQVTAVNPALPGSRAGLLTRAQGTMLVIDRTTYSLAPSALLEDRFGTPLSIQDLQCNEAQCRVQYWTVPDLGPDQILQMIVSFPE